MSRSSESCRQPCRIAHLAQAISLDSGQPLHRKGYRKLCTLELHSPLPRQFTRCVIENGVPIPPHRGILIHPASPGTMFLWLDSRLFSLRTIRYIILLSKVPLMAPSLILINVKWSGKHNSISADTIGFLISGDYLPIGDAVA